MADNLADVYDAYFYRVKDIDEFRQLFGLIHDQGLLERTFYGRVKTMVDFMDVMSDAYVYAVVENHKVVGITWINNISGLAGYCHVCLFSTAVRKVQLGRDYMEFVLMDSEFQTLVGLVPESYTHAAKYAIAIGFKFMCVIEDAIEINGEVEDMHLFKIKMEDI